MGRIRGSGNHRKDPSGCRVVEGCREMRVKAGGSLRKLSFKAPCSWAALFVAVGAKTGVQTNSRAHTLCPVPAFSLWHVRPLEAGLPGPGSEGEWDGHGMATVPSFCPLMVSLRFPIRSYHPWEPAPSLYGSVGGMRPQKLAQLWAPGEPGHAWAWLWWRVAR